VLGINIAECVEKTSSFRRWLELPQKHEQEHGDLLYLLVANVDL
jgi:hypothetical protein